MQEKLLKGIKEIMHEKGITGYRIAKDTHLSKSYIYKMLDSDDRCMPKVSTLNELAEGLHVSKKSMYRLADLQYQDVGDKVPVISYDNSTHRYIMNGKEVSKDNFKLISSMFNKLAE